MRVITRVKYIPRMKNKEAIFLFCLYFFLPQILHANEVFPREQVIEASLLAMEQEKLPEPTPDSQSQQIKIQTPEDNFGQEAKENIWRFADDIYLALNIQFGYLKGNIAYDFDRHTSELEFPMDNIMGGGGFSLGFKRLSLNAEFWTPIEEYAGFNMKDKDWFNGTLVSYTKSKAYMDAIIWDADLRYDFYQREEEFTLTDEKDKAFAEFKFDKVKIGALLGYKFERFDYDLYDLWYQYNGPTIYQGVKIGTYNIKYYLPYVGLAADLGRENYGIGFNIKYSFYPTARDIDNHLLRCLTFYGDYEKNGQAWIGDIYGFCEFIKNWQLKAGANWTSVRIDGITWDATHYPAWDKDQSTDTRQWLFWSGIEYRF